jgi:hypothetical protein
MFSSVLLLERDEYDGIFRVGSDQEIFNTLVSHNLVQIPVLFPVN